MDDVGLPLPAARCLSKDQAAAYLGIGVTLLADLRVPFIKIGRRCVYDKLDLDVWLGEYKQPEHWRAGKEKTLWPVKRKLPATGFSVLVDCNNAPKRQTLTPKRRRD